MGRRGNVRAGLDFLAAWIYTVACQTIMNSLMGLGQFEEKKHILSYSLYEENKNK